MLRFGIVTHGGVGAPAAWKDGCLRAAEVGYRILERGGHARDAVLEAGVVLEDDGRYNAGSGSVLRLDGRTVEMDAAIMDSEGRIGIVAALRGWKNPLRVAREVLDSPHVALAGEGAAAFARERAVAEPYPGPTPAVQERFENLRKRLPSGEAWKSLWNFPLPYEEVFGGCDTIGAVALDQEGRTAVANSTGGSSPMLAGRVGDSPMIGSGLFAGPSSAVAATGLGEEIIRRLLARRVYESISYGDEVTSACASAVDAFPAATSVGLIAIARKGWGAAHNRDMPWAVLVREFA